MCLKKSKILLMIGVVMLVFSVTAHAENKKFKFSLNSTSSKESSLGMAQKSYDGDTYAYVSPSASESSFQSRNATVKFRVRTEANTPATDVVTVSKPGKYVMPYLSGRAVGGARYRLYSNVVSASSYPVVLGGLWCP